MTCGPSVTWCLCACTYVSKWRSGEDLLGMWANECRFDIAFHFSVNLPCTCAMSCGFDEWVKCEL